MRTAAVLLARRARRSGAVSAQTKRPPAAAGRRQVPPRTEAAMVNCPTVLGQGAKTGRTFCDVLIERDPAAGITIPFPPHTGDVTLTLHSPQSAHLLRGRESGTSAPITATRRRSA